VIIVRISSGRVVTEEEQQKRVQVTKRTDCKLKANHNSQKSTSLGELKVVREFEMVVIEV
jgi:hypothetical protein